MVRIVPPESVPPTANGFADCAAAFASFPTIVPKLMVPLFTVPVVTTIDPADIVATLIVPVFTVPAVTLIEPCGRFGNTDIVAELTTAVAAVIVPETRFVSVPPKRLGSRSEERRG